MVLGNVLNSFIDNIERYDSILSLLSNTKNKDITGAETEFTIGKNYYNNNEFKSAFTHFKKSLNFHSTYTRSYIYISRIYIKKNMSSDARNLLEGIINIIPGYSLYSELSNIYSDKGMFSKIADLWKGFIKKFPESEKGYLHLGNYYSQNGQSTKAVECFEKILSIKKDNVNIREEIADIYLNNNDQQKARVILEDIYKNTNNSSIKASTGSKLINIYLEIGDKESIKPVLDEIKSYNNEEKFLILFSDGYILTGDYNECINLLNKIRKINPLNYKVYYRYLMLDVIFEDKDKLVSDMRMILKFIDSSKAVNFIKKYENMTWDEICFEIFEMYSSVSGFSISSLKNLILKNDLKEDENNINVIEDIEESLFDDYRASLDVVYKLNCFFEDSLRKHMKMIDNIAKMILVSNRKNNIEIDKIYELAKGNIQYLKAGKEVDSKDFENMIDKTVNNLKKGIDISSINNRKILERINQFRKKNIEIQGSMEKLLYSLKNLQDAYKYDEDIERFLEQLNEIIHKK